MPQHPTLTFTHEQIILEDDSWHETKPLLPPLRHPENRRHLQLLLQARKIQTIDVLLEPPWIQQQKQVLRKKLTANDCRHYNKIHQHAAYYTHLEQTEQAPMLLLQTKVLKKNIAEIVCLIKPSHIRAANVSCDFLVLHKKQQRKHRVWGYLIFTAFVILLLRGANRLDHIVEAHRLNTRIEQMQHLKKPKPPKPMPTKQNASPQAPATLLAALTRTLPNTATLTELLLRPGSLEIFGHTHALADVFYFVEHFRRAYGQQSSLSITQGKLFHATIKLPRFNTAPEPFAKFYRRVHAEIEQHHLLLTELKPNRLRFLATYASIQHMIPLWKSCTSLRLLQTEHPPLLQASLRCHTQ